MERSVSDLKYMVAFGFDEDGYVIKQITTLLSPDHDVEKERTKLWNMITDDGAIYSAQISIFVSSSYGDKKHADGKDLYRLHEIYDAFIYSMPEME